MPVDTDGDFSIHRQYTCAEQKRLDRRFRWQVSPRSERAINQMTNLVTTLLKNTSEDQAMRRQPIYTLLITTVLMASSSFGQELAKKEKNKTITPAAASQVVGGGTPGRISKWTGVSGSSTYVLGDSNIFEDKFGKIGIGTTTPTSLLTVQGMIEITMGGLKFPDGTLQTTAFSPSQVVRSLNGLTGDVQLAAGANITITPSGNTLTIAATSALTGVTHDTTLTGNGTAGSPLGVAVPLTLNGTGSWIIRGSNSGAGRGLYGDSNGSWGVFGQSFSSDSAGVYGTCDDCSGVHGVSTNNIGVKGDGKIAGVIGFSTDGFGVDAESTNSVGVRGRGRDGVLGIAFSQSATSAGIVGAGSGIAGGPIGALFVGNVRIQSDGPQPGNLAVAGTLSKGGGAFKIDHPLDPENKYLYHSFVESPDMKNIYDGNVVTDEDGNATVELPDYFEALNRDFRYQLTVIGTFAQAIIAAEIKENRFTIKTNAANVKVSWQVTGIRQDAFANKNRIPLVEAKPEVERGYYLHPEAFSQPEEKSINWARDPARMQQLKQRWLEVEQGRKRQQQR
jgi:hypothetical protein